jgi:DNA-binding transcriptional MerR regulator
MVFDYFCAMAKPQQIAMAFDFDPPAPPPQPVVQQPVAVPAPEPAEETRVLAPPPPNQIFAEPEAKPELAVTTEPLAELPAAAVEPEAVVEAAPPLPAVATPEPEPEPVAEKSTPLPVAAVAASEPVPPAAVTAVAIKKGIRGRRSIRELEQQADLVTVPEDEQLFQKQYYAMNEVAAMFNVNHSLLRYWENEFDILKPRKNRKGDRHFRPEDIKNLQVIHYLLRQKKYTIEGAKDYLKNKKKLDRNFEAIQSLEKLKNFLLELKAGL